MTRAERHWRAMGAKFGYPPCCIDYFCTTWDDLIKLSARTIRAIRIVDQYVARKRTAGMKEGFIPCPACLTRAELAKILDARTGNPVHSPSNP